jgi:hypothetical protein
VTRRCFPLIAALAVLAACTSSPTTAETPARPSSIAADTTSSPPVATSSPPPPPSPVPSLPAGLPPAFENDVPAGDVPAAALTPLRTEVTGTWRATTSEGEAIVVAWQVPGPDPFRLARGVAAWRRFDDGGFPWRPVWGAAWGKRAGVLSVDAVVADVTDDGSDDLVLFRGIGGSGACGTAEVVDLARGASVFTRDLCDARLDPSVDPVGLSLTEAVYEPGDPHCCPSAMRTTVLVWDGDTWIEDRVVTETP